MVMHDLEMTFSRMESSLPKNEIPQYPEESTVLLAITDESPFRTIPCPVQQPGPMPSGPKFSF